LQRNGELVNRQLMVGVQLLDARMRAAALHLTDSATSNASSIIVPRKQQQPLRAHRIDKAPASQVNLPNLLTSA
jgi:hypothetical protein